MQLTAHTDFALRVLMALGAIHPEQTSVRALSVSYAISESHLTKVVAKLSALGYVETQRGRDGGCRLAVEPESINVGTLVRQTEAELGVVACLRTNGECTIAPACALKSALVQATEAFLATLEKLTLSDLLEPQHAITQLLQLDDQRKSS